MAQDKAAPPTGKEIDPGFGSSNCNHVITVAQWTSGMPRELHSVIKVKGKGKVHFRRGCEFLEGR